MRGDKSCNYAELDKVNDVDESVQKECESFAQVRCWRGPVAAIHLHYYSNTINMCSYLTRWALVCHRSNLPGNWPHSTSSQKKIAFFGSQRPSYELTIRRFVLHGELCCMAHCGTWRFVPRVASHAALFGPPYVALSNLESAT